MKIIINLIGVGAGNNGGSHTLIQSANTLQSLGEEVIIIDNSPPKYDWNKIKVPYIKVRDVNDISGDVIIATGTGSVNSTMKSRIKNKIHWIRGFETWNIPEPNLIKLLKDSNTIKVVNSICLQRKLEKYKIKSEIIRPGHTFENFSNLNLRSNDKIILGGLYNQGNKRSKKRTNWIFDCYNFLKKKHNDIKIELWMYGSDGTPNGKNFVTQYSINPTMLEKNIIYNKIHIWLSTSELEGLHIPPAESMLTECVVVGNNSEMSGTEDYLIDNVTGLVSDNNFNSFLSNVDFLITNKKTRVILGKNGEEKIKSMGDRKENMQKFILFLKERMK